MSDGPESNVWRPDEGPPLPELTETDRLALRVAANVVSYLPLPRRRGGGGEGEAERRAARLTILARHLRDLASRADGEDAPTEPGSPGRGERGGAPDA